MTWMKHAEHGGIANLPDIPYWRENGWEPTDERPAESNPLRDPPEVVAEAETTEAPDAEAPGLSAAPIQKSAAAAKTKETDRG